MKPNLLRVTPQIATAPALKMSRLSSLFKVMLLGLSLLLTTLILLAPTSFADDPDPGFALRFDGVSDLVMLDRTDLMMDPVWTNTKTVEVWVKPTGTATCTVTPPAPCGVAHIDAIFGDRARWWGISRGTIGGEDRIWVWNTEVGNNIQQIGIPYTVGEWVHIALVHSDGVLYAYKNGIEIGHIDSGPTEQPLGGIGTPNNPVLYFGGIINNADRNWTFEGEIDEVRIWNTARTPAELVANMNHPLTGSEPGLAAYYQMSDGSGTSLTDDSGHGWTGTLLDGGTGVPADGPIQWVPSGAFTAPEPNLPPTANSQSVTTDEDTSVAITLTGTDPNSDTITITVVSQPTHGMLGGTAPNVVYTPTANFNGTDAFSYVAFDGQATSSPATATITITPQNDPPLAEDDTAIAVVDQPVTIPVLNNDIDIDGDTLSVSAVGTAEHGAATSDGTTVVFTPAAAFIGTDSFTYTINDGTFTDTANVTVTVLAENAPPIAVDDTTQTVMNTPVDIDVLANDSDPEGGTLTISQVGMAANGTTTNNNSSVTFTPATNFTGTNVFTYQIYDGVTGYDTASVTVTVLSLNTPPIAVDDEAFTNPDTAVAISVLSNDSDPNGDPITISSVGTPANGVTVHNGSIITYTPNISFAGVDVFSYNITDDRLGTDTATVTVTVGAGNALRFDGISDYVELYQTGNILTSTWTTTKTVELWVNPTGTANCTVAEHLCSANQVDNIFGDRPRSWGISRGTIGGEDKLWVWNNDGSIDQIGIDYTVGEWTHIALVHGNGMLRAYKNGAEVGSIPSGPTAGGSTLYLGGIINSADRNWTFSGDLDEVRLWNTARTQSELLANMMQPLTGSEPDLAAYYQMSDGSGASLTDNSGHGWTGTLKDGGSGVPADGPIEWIPSGAFRISITNASPIAQDDSATTGLNTSVSINVLENDTDADNDPLVIITVGTASHGSVSTDGSTIVYMPTQDFEGDDGFSYTISDNYGNTDTANVTVTVNTNYSIFLPLVVR